MIKERRIEVENQTKKEKNKQRGITLVALVVTIIVLVILAGVTIYLLLGQNGILGRAQEAKNKTLEAQEKEKNDLDLYVEMIDEKTITGSAREKAWNGATMLTISISDITGGTFTINVNNVEANNYGKLYYYVNDTLVYSGTNSSYQVTQVKNEPIKDNQTYEVKVLAEPFSLKVTTAEGDNIESWLSCIGNSNQEGYTFDNINELFKNTTLLLDLLSNDEANKYLEKSTVKIIPAFVDNVDLNLICSNQSVFGNICNMPNLFGSLLEKSEFRLAMYNNYSVTEDVLANSTNAIETIKKCSNYTRVNLTNITDKPVMYDGKAFIIGLSQVPWGGAMTETVYNLINGDSSRDYSVPWGYDGLTCMVKKFVSKVQIYSDSGRFYGDQFTYSVTILKIE